MPAPAPGVTPPPGARTDRVGVVLTDTATKIPAEARAAVLVTHDAAFADRLATTRRRLEDGSLGPEERVR